MTTAIVERLKTGTVANVIPFGFPIPGTTPYVVVKPEAGVNETRMFRIIPHYDPGQVIFLEDYTFSELSDLLTDWQGTDRNGNVFTVFTETTYGDIIADNDDGTISMERLFIVPQRMH